MKIVINACHGGFSLSDKAIYRYAELKGLTLYPEVDRFMTRYYWTVPEDKREGILSTEDFARASTEERIKSNALHSALVLYDRDIKRTDPALVQVVEELGSEANGRCARLVVIDILTGTYYRIDEYDGYESIEEREDIDWSIAT